MNHFFIELQSKEKANDLISEGMRNQAYYRSGAPKVRFLVRFPKLILIVLIIVGVLQMFTR